MSRRKLWTRALPTKLALSSPLLSKADITLLKRLYRNPVAYAKIFCGFDLWSLPDVGQVEICNSVRDHQLTAVRSGHGPGKSRNAAFIAIWFLGTNYSSRVITTATTGSQVRDVVWAEVGHLATHAKSVELRMPSGITYRPWANATILSTELRLNRNWFAVGYSTKTPENFQGRRGRRTLVIIDEASGVPDNIFTAIQGITTRPTDRILAVGNPTHAHGFFFDIWNHNSFGANWKKFHVDCETLPWVVAKKDPPVPGLVTWQYVERIANDYGVNSGEYKIRVKGDFDVDSSGLLISLELIQAGAANTSAKPGHPTVMGVDVGWMTDESVLSIVSGDRQVFQRVIAGKDPMMLCGEIVSELRRHPCDGVWIDAVGVGGGVYARLEELGVNVFPFRGGAPAWNSGVYGNARAEAYDIVRLGLQNRNLAILDDRVLMGQLGYQPKRQDSQGRLLIMSKKDWQKAAEQKKANWRSPDRADALAIARYGQRAMVTGAVRKEVHAPKADGEFHV